MILDDIKKIIESSVPNAKAYIFDPMHDGQHLEAIVVSSSFEGIMLVKQHQMVMKPLKEAFAQSVHALSLKTFTPAKWNEVRSQYPIRD